MIPTIRNLTGRIRNGVKMLPLRITGATRQMAEEQDEYHTLAIRDSIAEVPGVGFCPAMTSHWELTPTELEKLKRGGVVELTILGTTWPPVILTVKDITE